MVMCLYTKHPDAGVPFELIDCPSVIFHNGKLTVLVVDTDNIMVDDMWTRLPLYYAHVIAEKDSTRWDEPTTQTEGTHQFRTIVDSWCHQLMEPGDDHR